MEHSRNLNTLLRNKKSKAAVALLAAAALAGCASAENTSSNNNNAAPIDGGSVPVSAKTHNSKPNPTTTPESTKKSKDNGEGSGDMFPGSKAADSADICETVGGLEGASPVSINGETAEDTVINTPPSDELIHGQIDAVKKAIESGDIILREDTSTGTTLKPNQHLTDVDQVHYSTKNC
jgi:hypothetical protein